MSYLLFVDTNIYLDFYRVNYDVQLSLLEELEKIKDKIVNTYQVEMEFKKNRQKVIKDYLKELKIQQAICFPAFRLNNKSIKKTLKLQKELSERVAKQKQLLGKIMSSPLSHDKVYQICQKIFRQSSDLNLNREKKGKIYN